MIIIIKNITMNKFIKSALIAFTLLFSAQSMAECGMDGDNIEITTELCDTEVLANMAINLNPEIITENYFFKNDQIVKVRKAQLENDPQLKAELESNRKKNIQATNLMIAFVSTFTLIIAGLLAWRFVSVKFKPLKSEEDKHMFGYEYMLKIFAVVGVFKAFGSYTLIGWLYIYLVFTPALKIASVTPRFLASAIEFIYVKKDETGAKIATANTIEVNYEEYESRRIIMALSRIYNVMTQTDKVYAASRNEPLVSDIDSFIHDEGSRLEFYRKFKGSNAVAYTQGRLMIPAPNLDDAQQLVNSLSPKNTSIKLENYVTDDIGAIEQKLIDLRVTLIEANKLNNGSTVAIDTIIDTVFMHSKNKVMKKFYIELFKGDSLRKAFRPLLAQACYDNVGFANYSKKYLKEFLAGESNINGAPDCIFHNGMNYEVLGVESTLDDVDAQADRKTQKAWMAEHIQLLQDPIDKRHALIKQLAEIRISAGMTDMDKEIRRKVVHSSFNFILYSTQFIFNTQREEALTKSLFINSGEFVLEKGSEEDLVNYENLSRSRRSAFATGALDFGYYKTKAKEMIEAAKETRTDLSTTSLLWQAAETSSSYSEYETQWLALLTNPVTSFNDQILTQQCRDNGKDCEISRFNNFENVVQFGKRLTQQSFNLMADSIGLSMASNILNKFSGKIDKAKGSGVATKKTSLLTKGIGVMKDIAAVGSGVLGGLGGLLATIMAFFGIVFGTILPISLNLPFFMGYILFSLLILTIPVLCILFALWACLPNDVDNMKTLSYRVFVISVMVIFYIPLLQMAKVLAIYMVSIVMHVTAIMISHFTFSFGETLNAFVQVLVLIAFLVPMTHLAIKCCYGLITLFNHILGTTDYFESQALGFLDAIDNIFGKFIPIAALLRSMHGRAAMKSLTNPWQKRQATQKEASKENAENKNTEQLKA